jgi:uncharacterized membrane protein YkvA (DUF1232 family)
MSDSTSMPDSADFAEFISSNSAKVTPATVHELFLRLPELREKVATIEAPGFPLASEQFAFLADVVENFATERLPDFPLVAASEAAFALMYLDRSVDLIPDSVGPLGFTDDAAVAATVLLRNSAPFEEVARDQGKDWAKIAPPT